MLNSLKKIYSLFPKSDHFKLFILFGMMILASLLEVLGIGMIPLFVGAIAEPDKVLQYPVIGNLLSAINITSSQDLVVYGAFLLITVYIVKNVYLGFLIYIKKKFVANRGVYLQERLFKAYMTAPYFFYINNNSAELLRNVTGEVNKIFEGTVLPFMELLLNATMFIFIMATLVIFEPIITFVVMIILGGGGYFFLRYTQRKTSDYGHQDREASGEMNKAVIQGLGGFKDARVLHREKLFLEEYRKNAEISKIANIYRYVVGSLPKPIYETLAVIGILLIALIMVWEGRAIAQIIPTLALFGAATIRLMPTINQVISQTTTIRYNAYSVYAIHEDLQTLEQDYKIFREKILNESVKVALRKNITLESVSYNYPEADEQAIIDVSLTIPKGKAVAFVGASGAGKTTLVDIILGLLEPKKGCVKVDGIDVSDNIRGWMKNIGYIPQTIFLLDDSIRSNIAFGIPEDEIDEEKLKAAIEAAQLGDLIERLPNGELTVVGERGVRLSGGQQQRIGIARALYNNPQVLIMDEATSALDNITEKYVIKAIEKLKGEKTIIMIAHRLTTVQNCDRIYLMKEGRVIEKGTYNKLLEDSSEFRKMSLVE